MNNEETLKELGFYENLQYGVLKPNWIKSKVIKPFDLNSLDNLDVIKSVKKRKYKNVTWQKYLGKSIRPYVIECFSKGMTKGDILNKIFDIVKYKPTDMTQKRIKHLINRNIETTISIMKKRV